MSKEAKARIKINKLLEEAGWRFLEQEQQLINANKELIKMYEQKIKDEINKLWQRAATEYVVVD
jgi:hypothetical protein